MKKIILSPSILITGCSIALPLTPVLFTLQTLTGTVNNRTVTVVPDVIQNPLVVGTNFISFFPFVLQPIGGQVQTNLAPWGYTIKVDGWPRTAHIVVPDSTNVINAATLINTNQFSPLILYFSGGGSGSQTPWISDIDAAGHSLNNLNSLSAGSATFSALSFSGLFSLTNSAGDSNNITANSIDLKGVGGGEVEILTNSIIISGLSAAGLSTENISDHNGNTVIKTAEEYLLTSLGIRSIDWEDRLLEDTSGDQSGNWGTRLLYDSEGDTTLDWNNRKLSGLWSADGFSAVYLTNSDPGVVLNVANPIQMFRTNASYTITGFTGQTSTTVAAFHQTILNTSGSSITVTMPAPFNPIGPATTNSLVLPAGKRTVVAFEIWPDQTNLMNCQPQ